MKLLVQFEGLLWRFGRVAPDAIAMMESIRLLQSRLRARDSDTAIALRLFRGPEDRALSSAGQRADVLSVDEARALKHYFGFTGEQLSVSGGLLSLIRGQSKHRRDELLVLTSNVETYRRCATEGVEAVRIGDRGSQSERWVPYADVMRVLEERLRIPTARPMARGVRIGGLLAIQAGNASAAWEKALMLIREDPSADWVVIDNMLILYTENPDLEDSLEAESDIERLALAVHKDRLFLTDSAHSNDSDALYQAGRFRLREATDEQLADIVAHAPEQSWTRIRRRRLAGAPSESKSKGKQPESLPENLVIPTKTADDIPVALMADAKHLRRNLRQQISSVLVQAVSPDCFYDDGESQAVTWMTPYGITENDLLAALLYRLPDEGVSTQDTGTLLANAVRGIFAITRWLVSVKDRLAVVHCIALHQGVSIDEVLKFVLLGEEQNRLSLVIEFDELLRVQSGEKTLVVRADASIRESLSTVRLEHRSIDWLEPPDSENGLPCIRLSGGDWCQSPGHPDSVGAVQAVLHALLT